MMKNIILTYLLFFIACNAFAQEEEKQKAIALNESKNLTWNANKNLADNNFVEAEVGYRKAIAKSGENAAAPYNLGNAYYNTESYSEAFGRFKEAGESATDKADKHSAYHNMGNVFMKRKEYEKAVEFIGPGASSNDYLNISSKEKSDKDEENNIEILREEMIMAAQNKV